MTAKLSRSQIDELRSVIANLDGLQAEIAAAVKRKAGEPITPFQGKIINGVIERANGLLGNDRPIAEFEVFNLDDIPTASDVAMVAAQYVEAFEKIRCEHITKYPDGWVWSDALNINTVPPRARK